MRRACRLSAFALVLFLSSGCSTKTTAPGGAGTPAPSGAAAPTVTQPARASNPGNGSSGMGNFVGVTPTLSAYLATPDSVRKDGATLVDAKSGEKLIQVEDAGSEKDLRPAGDGELVRSQLGAVDGYEFVPRTGRAAASNYWVVCNPQADGNGPCTKLTPLSNTNPKVPEIIGTLRRVAKILQN